MVDVADAVDAPDTIPSPPPVEMVECDACHGQGRVIVGGYRCPREIVACGYCEGTGAVPEEQP